MRRKVKNLFVVVAVLVISLLFVNTASARDDWAFTLSDLVVKYKLNDEFTLKLNYNTSAKEDKKPSYYSYARVGLIYSPYEWLDLTPTYHHAYSRANNGKLSHEDRLFFDTTFKWKAMGLKFSDRNRMELRNFDIRPDHVFRYRNEFMISKVVDFMGTKVVPFISDEIWYDLTDHEADFNWATIGVSKKLTKNLIVSLFYRLESFKTGEDWSETNFIGTGIVLSY